MIEKVLSDAVKKTLQKEKMTTSFKKTIFTKKINVKTKKLQEPLSF